MSPSFPHVDPAQLAATLGITPETGDDYQFTDTFGVTYTGAPAHVAVSALARPDIVDAAHDTTSPFITRAASLLITWFTSPYAHPRHVEDFARQEPIRVCEQVAYLVGQDELDALEKVGPESLRLYTGHLLYEAWHDVENPLPRLIDRSHRSVTGHSGNPAHRLQITAIAPNDADMVQVPMEIEVSEQVYWELAIAVPVPVDELNDLLRNPSHLTGDYITDHRELIDDHLCYETAYDCSGLEVTGKLVPGAADADLTTAPARTELYFVGTDLTSALAARPFLSRRSAERHCVDTDGIFGMNVCAAAAYPVTRTQPGEEENRSTATET